MAAEALERSGKIIDFSSHLRSRPLDFEAHRPDPAREPAEIIYPGEWLAQQATRIARAQTLNRDFFEGTDEKGYKTRVSKRGLVFEVREPDYDNQVYKIYDIFPTSIHKYTLPFNPANKDKNSRSGPISLDFLHARLFINRLNNLHPIPPKPHPHPRRF